MRVYCDTNVFLDYLLDRSDSLRPLNDFAFLFFSKGWNCAFELVVSEWLMHELSLHVEKSKVSSLIEEFSSRSKLIHVKQDKSDWENAKHLSNHPDDALHAILAERAECSFLVTRNLRHFESVGHLCRIVPPEFV
ncbi:MAG: PIN domain-containing protein [Candidatus Woesearchaeota archaeon]